MDYENALYSYLLELPDMFSLFSLFLFFFSVNFFFKLIGFEDYCRLLFIIHFTVKTQVYKACEWMVYKNF